jgi:flagellar L-ring protein FlgH
MTERLKHLGTEPPLSPIENPQHLKGYKRVQMPMPNSYEPKTGDNSLWRQGRKSFFKDQRASQVGDILTIEVRLSEYAKLNNQTVRSRNSADTMGAPNLLGLEAYVASLNTKKKPDLKNLLNLNSTKTSAGAGTVNRKEDISMDVAAVVTQILPNGNMVVMGRQQMRVNFELRELQVAGIIRPEDINPAKNSVSLEKIAEARLSYGGRGHLTDTQQERVGQQILDVLLPF